MFSGYVFWLILSKFTTSEVIGIAAAVISVSNIFITISAMAIQNGLQRFMGKSFGKQEKGDVKVFVKSAILLTTAGIVASSVFILVVQNWIVETLSIDISIIFIIILIISSTCYYKLLRSAIIATLKTRMLPLVIGISTIAKISVALILINFGMGAVGILIGFVLFDILAGILLAINLLLIIKTRTRSNLSIFESMKNLLPASVVSWVPALISAFGTHLGTIIIFSSQGASQAGVYFIAFAITSAIFALMNAPLGIAFPKLSGMQDGRKRFAWGITKISLLVFLPLSTSMIFYSEEILRLFGESYVTASFAFQILLISIMPLIFMNGVRSLTYAYGNYNHVLLIGIIMNVPRIILYFILVPIIGDTGAGISFTVGSVISFLASIIIAKKIRFTIFWKDIGIILAVPLGLSFILSYSEIYFFIGIPVTIIISYVLFLKMRIITKTELQYSMEVLPKKIGQPTLNFLNRVAKILNNSW